MYRAVHAYGRDPLAGSIVGEDQLAAGLTRNPFEKFFKGPIVDFEIGGHGGNPFPLFTTRCDGLLGDLRTIREDDLRPRSYGRFAAVDEPVDRALTNAKPCFSVYD